MYCINGISENDPALVTVKLSCGRLPSMEIKHRGLWYMISYTVAQEWPFKMIPVAKNLTIYKYLTCRCEYEHVCQESHTFLVDSYKRSLSLAYFFLLNQYPNMLLFKRCIINCIQQFYVDVID